MDNQVSVEFLTLLRNSLRQLEAAQATNQFLQSNLVSLYQLKGKDQVNMLTGAITREANGSEPPAPSADSAGL